MLLPGRLRSTSLGDLLGTIHRASATGVLELAEDRGRTHRIHFGRGFVVAVELDGAASPLGEILRSENAVTDEVLRRSLLRAMASQRLHGEVLISDFHLAPSVVRGALRRQILSRLAVLDRLADARIAFRVAVRTPRGAVHDAPLQPREFLHGRRRACERGGRAVASTEASHPSAWQALGLDPGADPLQVKRAYRLLARRLHPDAHPGASEEERRVLQARFAAVTDAYRAIVAG